MDTISPLQDLLRSASESPTGSVISSGNRIALRSILLREIAKSTDDRIRNLAVEYSPLSPKDLLILPKELAKEFYARPKIQ